MRKVAVRYGQSLYDIAIQCYGCAEGVFLILEDNPTVNLVTDLYSGQELSIRDVVPEITEKNKRIAEQFRLTGEMPNSGLDYSQTDFEPADYTQEFN